MSIHVRYYDGITATAHRATIEPHGEHIVLSVQGKQQQYAVKHIKVHPSLGHVYPTIDLPDDGYIELLQAEVPEWLHPSQQRLFWQRLWQWENKLHYVLFSSIAILVLLFALVRYGVPVAAKTIANNLPASTEQILGQQSLKALDSFLFKPSTITTLEQQRLHKLFQTTLKPPTHVQLMFRNSAIGANALALPSGIIILTDDLVHLAENDQELLAVLAHELGHIEQRHGLRSALSAAGVGVILGALTGDMESLISAMPTILIQLQYSRDFELEADLYAHQTLMKQNIPLHHFADILLRLSQDTKETGDKKQAYWQTHPDTHERIKPFLEPK